MNGVLQEIRNYIPSIILKLYQKRLLDKNCEITQEEILEAHWELAEQIKFLEYQQERLRDKQFMLERIIHKDDLLSPLAKRIL